MDNPTRLIPNALPHLKFTRADKALLALGAITLAAIPTMYRIVPTSDRLGVYLLALLALLAILGALFDARSWGKMDEDHARYMMRVDAGTERMARHYAMQREANQLLHTARTKIRETKRAQANAMFAANAIR